MSGIVHLNKIIYSNVIYKAILWDNFSTNLWDYLISSIDMAANKEPPF
ncbi:MAG: hypothetical protein P8N05_02850 [Polaribacter sp.]|nr:hypothetical protein [Polaribacter sp.]